MQKILLHACCAVCCAYCIRFLRQNEYEPVVYFYNPNIYPKKEYDIRLNELVEFSKKENFELIIENYTPQDFNTIAYGLENEPEKGKRCEKCFLLILDKSAKKAKELNIKKFTTTLSISPHKVFQKICDAANIAEKTNNVEFAPYNFKKKDGFKLTQKIAQENNMYKQTYCGCEYSIRQAN